MEKPKCEICQKEMENAIDSRTGEISKFRTLDFLIAFTGGTFLTLIVTQSTNFLGTIFIGFIIGIIYEEMVRYNKILEEDPNYSSHTP